MKLFKNLIALSVSLVIFQFAYHQVVAEYFPKSIAHFLVAAQAILLGGYILLFGTYLAISLSRNKSTVKKHQRKAVSDSQTTVNTSYPAEAELPTYNDEQQPAATRRVA